MKWHRQWVTFFLGHCWWLHLLPRSRMLKRHQRHQQTTAMPQILLIPLAALWTLCQNTSKSLMAASLRNCGHRHQLVLCISTNMWELCTVELAVTMEWESMCVLWVLHHISFFSSVTDGYLWWLVFCWKIFSYLHTLTKSFMSKCYQMCFAYLRDITSPLGFKNAKYERCVNYLSAVFSLEVCVCFDWVNVSVTCVRVKVLCLECQLKLNKATWKYDFSSVFTIFLSVSLASFLISSQFSDFWLVFTVSWTHTHTKRINLFCKFSALHVIKLTSYNYCLFL